MNDIPPLLIRADAGGALGTGHVMRMIALAQAWQDRGGRVVLAACCLPVGLQMRLEEEEIFTQKIDAEPGGEKDLQTVRELAADLAPAAVVLDGYHFHAAYQMTLRNDGLKLMCVDDYGHCDDWHATWVLNSNLHAKAPVAGDSDNSSPQFLAGPKFALLRREFHIKSRAHTRAPDRRNRILLISFGGVDPPGATLRVLDALALLPQLDWNPLVIVGAGNPRIEEIRGAAAHSPLPVEVIVDARDMPKMYLQADALISAGGSSCLEWLLFGLPAWVISIAENQNPVVEALRQQGLATVAGNLDDFPDRETMSEALARWLAHPTPPNHRPVDGWGASRVACRLAGASCWIKPVDPDCEMEARFLHELANEPSVRSAGYHTEMIAWPEHLAWLQRHAASPASFLWLVHSRDDARAGLVRFHRHSDNVWEAGISIAPKHRGGGLAADALRLGILALRKIFPDAIILATIRPENIPSRRLFESLCFSLNDSTADKSEWLLHPPTT